MVLQQTEGLPVDLKRRLHKLPACRGRLWVANADNHLHVISLHRTSSMIRGRRSPRECPLLDHLDVRLISKRRHSLLHWRQRDLFCAFRFLLRCSSIELTGISIANVFSP
jgi:hypothetical protein